MSIPVVRFYGLQSSWRGRRFWLSRGRDVAWVKIGPDSARKPTRFTITWGNVHIYDDDYGYDGDDPGRCSWMITITLLDMSVSLRGPLRQCEAAP